MLEPKEDFRAYRELRAGLSSQPSGNDASEARPPSSVVVELPLRPTSEEPDPSQVPSTTGKPRQRRSQSRSKQGGTRQKQVTVSPDPAPPPPPSGQSLPDLSTQKLRSNGSRHRQAQPVNPENLVRSLRAEQVWQSQASDGERVQEMESKMHRIKHGFNQLSEDLDQFLSAIEELKGITSEMNSDPAAPIPNASFPGNLPPQGTGGPIPSPETLINQVKQFRSEPYGGASRRSAPPYSEQEAAVNAQTLRHWTSRERGATYSPGRSAPPGEPRPRPRRFTLKHALQRFRRFLQLPQNLPALVVDTIAWVVGAATVRVGLLFLLHNFPILQIPITVLMVAPAILAAYLALFVPRSGVISGYRLLLVMLGLWLGGRWML